MVKFKPTTINLTVDETQLNVLSDIHEAIESISKKLQRLLPNNFPKGAEVHFENIKSNLECLDVIWQEWVLEKFKKEFNAAEFFTKVGIKRMNPWDRNDINED